MREAVIKDLTASCQREDCEIGFLGSSMTLLGWAQTYDKHGQPIGRDPNTTTSAYRCNKCGVSWTARFSGLPNDVEIERHEPGTDDSRSRAGFAEPL